jgi:hypothetical protein
MWDLFWKLPKILVFFCFENFAIFKLVLSFRLMNFTEKCLRQMHEKLGVRNFYRPAKYPLKNWKKCKISLLLKYSEFLYFSRAFSQSAEYRRWGSLGSLRLQRRVGPPKLRLSPQHSPLDVLSFFCWCVCGGEVCMQKENISYIIARSLFPFKSTTSSTCSHHVCTKTAQE